MTRPPFTETERGEKLWERVCNSDSPPDFEIKLASFRREQEDYYNQDEIRAEMRGDT